MDRRVVVPLAVSLAIGAACTSERVGGPSQASTSVLGDLLNGGPRFLRPAPDAPPLAQTASNFYAVRGEHREVRIMYRARPGAADSTEFLRFEVPPGSLARHPDGTPVADGDSVLIRVTVVDTVRLIVKFEPAGLGFASNAPARLKMSYAETDDDINGDGRVDSLDQALETLFQIWRQERIGDPFVALPSLLDQLREFVSVSVVGFTHYAISY